MKQLPTLISELGPLLGAQLQKLRRSGPQELVLQLRLPGATHFLLLSWEPGVARLHLCARPEGAAGLPADGFVRRLRQELKGARLLGACCSLAGDAVWLEFERAGQPRCLLQRFEAPTARMWLLGPEHRPLAAQRPRRGERGKAWPLPEDACHARQVEAGPEAFATHRRVAARYAEHGARLRQAAAQKQGRKVLKKAQRLLANLERDAARCRESLDRAADAELLKAELQRVPRGASEIWLRDPVQPEAPARRLPLDPALSASANLQKLFRKAKKGRRGLEHLRPRLEEARRKVEERQAALASGGLPDAVPVPQASPASARKDAARQPYGVYTARDGRKLWVGRNARANDAMLRQARGNDQWLHVRGLGGSHVIVRRTRGDASQEALLDAATLAAHFSKARGHPQVDVRLAYVKDLRKVKGVPGKVTVQRETTMRLRFEPDRLRRLLGQAP